MGVADLADLGSFAHRQRYYGRAAELLGSSLRQVTTDDDADIMKLFGDQIRSQAKESVKLNNKALMQKQMLVGDNHKSADHLIDEVKIRTFVIYTFH